MKVTKKDLSATSVEFTVVADKQEIKHAHDESVRLLSRDVKVKGFREGHVPAEVAEKAMNPATLASEEANHAINDALSQLVRDNHLQILDQPDVEVTKFVPGQILEFKATLEIAPKLKMPDFSKISVKREPVKITDAQVDEILANLQKGQASKEKVERAAKNGDEAEIDFEGFSDGVAFDGGKGEKYPLVLGSGSFIPGFEEQVVGHKKGDEFDVKVDFPKDYGAKNLAGKPAVFKVTLREVREVKLPKLDDAFAKTLAPDLKTLDDLKRDIRRELTARGEQEADGKFQNDLITAVADKVKIDKLPEVLVGDQLQAVENEFSTNLMYRGMTLEQFLKTEKLTHDEWVKRDLRPVAETRTKKSMILAQLAQEWQITAADDEVASRQAELMARYTRPELRDRLKQPAALREIAQQIVTEKTLAKLAQQIAK